MSKLLKPTVLAASIAMVTPSVYAGGIELSDNLSVTGFIDMSMVYTDVDGGGSSSTAGLDQFEIDLMYTFDDKLTAQVDVEYQDDGAGQVTDVEQAFFTYAVNEEVSVKAGRFLSYSGWETEEPTGLYQYSGTGYAQYFYGAYQQGVSTTYNGGKYQVAATLATSLGTLTGGDTDAQKVGTEFMLALNPTDELTVKAFFMSHDDTDLINMWASYAVDDLTVAVEYNLADSGTDEGTGYLLMANYAMDDFGITVRYHAYELEDASDTVFEEMSAITISPSFKVNDNLLIVTEYRMDDDDLTGGSTDSVAVEALLTF
ncbi:MAG: porin [Pseudomonadales bacterium]|nr:porin [Pseudomonadales bacterium]